MDQSLEIFKVLGCEHLFSMYQAFYEQHTESKAIKTEAISSQK
jgi:hypothetical protein